MKLNKIMFGIFSVFPFFYFMKEGYAHCPLCTAGAIAAAGGAAYLGVNNAIVGLFLGAFAVSTGWWVSKYLKQYIPFQRQVIIITAFVTTVLPVLPFIESNYPFYISIIGDYGTLLNSTYIINLFLIGSILGGFIVSIAPWFSRQVSRKRNGKIIPYQGLLLALSMLVASSIVIQLWAGF